MAGSGDKVNRAASRGGVTGRPGKMKRRQYRRQIKRRRETWWWHYLPLHRETVGGHLGPASDPQDGATLCRGPGSG
ncbi:hypothetical protein VI35_10300 [Aeromonas caviae]|uniref:Uncharacterized protein n=1 Tax=Aeromonas caviae TaxID=648 RepID=A0A2K0KTW9_AERCA|nr:hypothetical protein VI35_10300 [Aeromonas caviae]AUT40848.1 hypothetical protein C2U30_03465 [Aeromonas sp. ASNIH5]AUV18654.1 hypothetical protein C2U47_20715 [Aeromonas sp. ASNIH7]PNO50970.1 hypothetical protein MC65_022960 [Aeromonas caviae]POV84922.1 hypothetical protein C3418_22025 [Aeromonas sp. ASNIH8]